jgi:hypothetical protein
VSASLALARYRVTLEALEPLDLPHYLGSTLRGAFGHAFRRLCCLGREGEPCRAPALYPYHLVFETAPPPDAAALRTHEEIPRPHRRGTRGLARRRALSVGCGAP